MADNLIRLRIDSSEYDQKLKRAAEGLQRYADGCRKVGGTLEVVEKDTLDYVKALGKMETSSRTATGKLAEMKKAFTEFSSVYKNMTEQEKQSPFGKALSQSLVQLKVRINESKDQLAEINRELSGSKFGQFGSVIDSVGQKFGITGNITEMLTSKTALLTGAIGAVGSAVAYATKEWAAYNQELAKQDQITTVTTGLKGDDAERMTSAMRALSRTYGADFRQAVNAANTLMSQFGATGDEAIKLLRDGMQGMIMGDAPKLLQMIQQFAPAFHDAGVSASQLVAVIQNSEGGLFTDQNMQAIVMGIKNIRLMTKQTSEALAKLGIDGQEMSRKMSDGSLSVFDALKQVSSQLKNVDAGSQTAGEVMQAVFGRQGAMAGTNLANAIETLNTDLAQTKKQTGELGESLADLQQANERLEVAIRDCFGYDGWETMSNGIKTKLVGALADVLEVTNNIKNSWVGELYGNIFETISEKALESIGPLKGVAALLKYIRGGGDDGNIGASANVGGAIGSARNDSISEIPEVTVLGNRNRGNTNTTIGQAYRTINRAEGVTVKGLMNPGGGGGGGGRGGKNTPEYIPLEGSIDAQTKKVQELQKAWRAAADDDSRKKIKEQIEQAQAVLDAMNGKVIAPDGSLKALNAELAELNKQRELLTDPIEIEIIDNQIQDVKDEIDQLNGKKVEVELAVDNRTPFEKLKDSLKIEIAEENMQVDTTTLQTLMKTAIQNGIDGLDPNFSTLQEKMREGMNIPDSTWEDLQTQINEKLKELGIDPIKINFDTGNIEKEGKKTEKSWQAAAQAVESVGGAMQSIEDPAAKVAGTVMQAIASVALGYAQATTQAATLGPWAWVAFAATGMAQMMSMISGIHNATGYAEGGIIKGNSYSGDNIMANVGEIGLNAGELVLNKAQQSTLASELQNGGNRIQVVGRLSGEQLFLCAENWAKRTGKGEFVTWR